jgi:predicted GH43/DUF377 family glycosyl hydrolase
VIVAFVALAAGVAIFTARAGRRDTAGGWRKAAENPLLGGRLGTCFDVSVLKEDGRYRMWFSWRPKKGVALVESEDGVHWGEPAVVLEPAASGWEQEVNRPVVLKRPDGYHMWYTGQAGGRSAIGHAVSEDGRTWKRTGSGPVLSPEQTWEKAAVMCPHVLWDEEGRQFRLWYSGGEQREPDAIGCARSPDGLHWTKWPGNPVFTPQKDSEWERAKVTACQVVKQGEWHIMFYVGFKDSGRAAIGLARSRDGVTGWQRHPANPIVRPGRSSQWDGSAVYKPFAIPDGGRWLLWYNGRSGQVEQIGLAIHDGEDLGFK